MPWKKGDPSPNKRGRPRSGTALSERIREAVDVDEMIHIFQEIMRGVPMVRLIDRQTGRPRLAATPMRNLPSAPGEMAPVPITMVPDDALIHDITWITTDERMKAGTWLATMGGMKPPAEVAMSVTRDDGSGKDFDFSKLTPAELEAYVLLMDKASTTSEEEDSSEIHVGQKIIDVPSEATSISNAEK